MCLQTFCLIVRRQLTIDPFLRFRPLVLWDITEIRDRELGKLLDFKKVDFIDRLENRESISGHQGPLAVLLFCTADIR
jgi:hypothetical protein